jgi:transposase-like protein
MASKSAKSTYSDAGGDLRLPEPHGDLQVNACRNPACPNFAVEALSRVDLGRPKKDGSSRTDNYRLNGSQPDTSLLCKSCNKSSAIKSNKAISEELQRLSEYLIPTDEPGCPTPGCSNESVGVFSNPQGCVCKARRKTSRRLVCKACRHAFSIKDKSFAGQKQPHKNKTVFMEIVSKKPIRGIAQVAELSPKAVYDKIDFIYAQCRGFAADREARAHRIKRKYVRLCIDRQDYLINWQSRQKRKNIQFTSICTVEGKTGYVLGHHLNYDPERNQVEVDDAARVNGDFDSRSRKYFHAHSQYWKSDEFYAVANKQLTEIRPCIEEEPMLVEDLIRAKDQDRRRWPELEMADYPARGNQLPPDGVMTHLDYTAYAHAILTRRLIGQPSYTTIYMDQDEVLRGAYTSAFGRVEMATVQFQKLPDIDEKRRLSNTCKPRLRKLENICGCGLELAISRKMAWDYANLCATHPDWRKRWVSHPKDTINEPHRRIQ